MLPALNLLPPFRPEGKMKTRSIYKTYTELDHSWQAGIPVSLARTGPRRFEIGEDAGRKSDFIYDVGFVLPQSLPSVADTETSWDQGSQTPRTAVAAPVGGEDLGYAGLQSSRRANLAALRKGGAGRLTNPSAWVVKKLWPKFLRLPKPARYLVGAIVLAYLILRIVRIVPALSSLDALGQSHTPQSLSAAAPVGGTSAISNQAPKSWSDCQLVLDRLSPVATVTEPFGSGQLELVHDIIIGGERQQQVTFDCGGAQQDYLVRFSKLNGTWKAKSATPLGSHSE